MTGFEDWPGSRLRIGAALRTWAPELALLVLSVPVLLYGLGSYSLVNGDEAFYQGVAEHMVESGNWFRLEFRSQPRVYDTFMNAPLQYWARALLITAFGSNLWTTRVLSALFGVATVWATVRLGRQLGSCGSAFLAGLVLLTTCQFVFLHSARTGELETALSFLFVVIALRFHRAVATGAGFGVHHLCLVALLHLKAPLVAIPVAAQLGAFALQAEARPHFVRWLRTGLAVLPLALVWHLPQAIVLWDEVGAVVARMTADASGSRVAGAGGASNLLYYGKVLLFGVHPYVFAFPPALVAVLWRRPVAERGAWLRVGAYPLAVLVFYGLVAKSAPWYVIPAYPFLALYTGRWLADLGESGPSAGELVALAVLGAFLAWSHVSPAAFDPFATTAIRIPMEVAWKHAGGLGPVGGIAITSAGLLVALAGLRRALGRSAGPLIGWGATATLVTLALVRVSLPLAHLEHRSEIARLHDTLREKRAAGSPVDFPITVRSPSALLVRYYFADEFRIHVTALPGSAEGSGGPPRVAFQLAGWKEPAEPDAP